MPTVLDCTQTNDPLVAAFASASSRVTDSSTASASASIVMQEVRALQRLSRALAHRCAVVGKRLRLFDGAVPDPHVETRLGEVTRHRRAHDACAEHRNRCHASTPSRPRQHSASVSLSLMSGSSSAGPNSVRSWVTR